MCIKYILQHYILLPHLQSMPKIAHLAILVTFLSSCAADRLIGRNPNYLTPSGEEASIRQTRIEIVKGDRDTCIWYTDKNDNGSYDKGEPYTWCGGNKGF